MKYDFFEGQINRLKETFGDKNYNQERFTIFWNNFKFELDGTFEKAVTSLIANSKYAPLLNEIKEAVFLARPYFKPSNNQKEDPTDPVKYDCDYCKDTGFYLCTKPDSDGLWAFRCHCHKGNIDHRRAIQQYKQDHADQGFKYAEVARS